MGKSVITEKNIKTIKSRLELFILNSFLYKQYINEKFIESKDLLKGKRGLESKYSVQLDSIMKDKTLKALEDLEIKWMDNILYKATELQNTDLWLLEDIEFIEYLDRFCFNLFKVLELRIFEVNRVELKREFDEVVKDMSINKLKDMTKEFMTFVVYIRTILNRDVVNDYISVIGNEPKRLMKYDFGLPRIKEIDYNSLEESGADIMIPERKMTFREFVNEQERLKKEAESKEVEKTEITYPDGVYVSTKVAEESQIRLAEYVNKYLIGAKLEEYLHCTLIYSKKPEEREIEVKEYKYIATFDKFSLFGENKDTLVIEINCDSMKNRNKELTQEYSFISDFDEYKPHITLAFETSVDVNSLPEIDFCIYLEKEYAEALIDRTDSKTEISLDTFVGKEMNKSKDDTEKEKS